MSRPRIVTELGGEVTMRSVARVIAYLRRSHGVDERDLTIARGLRARFLITVRSDERSSIPGDGDTDTCANCGKPISWDGPMREWFHTDGYRNEDSWRCITKATLEAWPMSKPIYRLPREWEVIDGISVVDPDGWDRKDFLWDWRQRLNRAEWDEKVSLSTIHSRHP